MRPTTAGSVTPYLCGIWPEGETRLIDTADGQELEDCPSVAVVVPAHNSAVTIVATVKSLLAALRHSDAIYIVENGSTDDTLALLNRHFAADPAVHILQSPEANAATARSLGVAAASDHEYVAFCDADDLWMPHKLDIIRRIIKREASDLIFHPMLSVGERRLELEGSGFLNKRLPRTERLGWDLARYGNFLTTSATVFRRSLLAEPPFLACLRQTQDYEAWCAAAFGRKHLKYAYVDATLGIHFWMGGLSKSLDARMRNVWSIATSYISDAPRMLRLATLARTFAHIVWWLAKSRRSLSLVRVLSARQNFLKLRALGKPAPHPKSPSTP